MNASYAELLATARDYIETNPARARVLLNLAISLSTEPPGLGEIAERAQDALTQAHMAKSLGTANRDSIENIRQLASSRVEEGSLKAACFTRDLAALKAALDDLRKGGDEQFGEIKGLKAGLDKLSSQIAALKLRADIADLPKKAAALDAPSLHMGTEQQPLEPIPGPFKVGDKLWLAEMPYEKNECGLQVGFEFEICDVSDWMVKACSECYYMGDHEERTSVDVNPLTLESFSGLRFIRTPPE